MSEAISYVAESADRYRLHALDGFTLLYHRPSTLTHMLVSPAPEILSALADRPLTAPEIVNALAAAFDLRLETDDAIAVVKARLEELALLGLVRRA